MSDAFVCSLCQATADTSTDPHALDGWLIKGYGVRICAKCFDAQEKEQEEKKVTT